MKNKENSNNQKNVSKTIDFSNEKKDGKINLNNDYTKNHNLSLFLRKQKEKQRETEKANSTTQTRHKNLMISNDDILKNNLRKSVQKSINNIISKKIDKNVYENIPKNTPKNIHKKIHKSLYDNIYNSERNKKILKNNKFFIFKDKLNSKRNTNEKIFLRQENEKKKNNDINIIDNNKKLYKLNNLTIKNVYYNTIVDTFIQKKKKYKDKKISMYHYYNLNQRRIERIIPNINEYLQNNTDNKKMFKAYNIKAKSINNNNKYNPKNVIQRSNFNYRPKSKDNNNNNIKTKINIKKNILMLKSENFDLCLFNSINNNISSKNKKILASSNEKVGRRIFSSKAPFKKQKFWNLDNVNININNKMRVGAFNYTSTSTSNQKIYVI